MAIAGPFRRTFRGEADGAAQATSFTHSCLLLLGLSGLQPPSILPPSRMALQMQVLQPHRKLNGILRRPVPPPELHRFVAEIGGGKGVRYRKIIDVMGASSGL